MEGDQKQPLTEDGLRIEKGLATIGPVTREKFLMSRE